MTSADHISALISNDNLTETLSDIVDIASPTGEEATLAAHISDKLASFGYDTETQPLGESQANAIAVLKGKSDGKRLLLYAPLDTVTSNSESEDLPWVGPELRPDMRAKAQVKDGHIIGLGAQNPKGHAACIVEAARILKQLDVPLAGDIYFGFGAGGMPTHSRPNMKPDTGHGVGCAHLLSLIPKPDAAIIAKSGAAVTWEEVGFIWIDVHVSGTHTYVGSIHLLPYESAISSAGKLIVKLEDWFEKRAEAHATDCVKPQGVVSFIDSGWERMPAFTPATCRFRIDLRFGPDISGDEAEAEFDEVLHKFCNELSITANFERVQTIEASRTDYNSEIIQTAIKAWEAVKEIPHQPFTEMSGATDANIIRQHGIPTARMGLPKADLPDFDFQMGMNCAALADLRNLTAMLVLSSLHYCGEPKNG